jgi:cobalt-zinc-cadmium efflux system membrane fusion protein
VVDLAVARGEFRNDAVTPLMTVADLSTVWLTANVQEKDIRNVAKDGEVTAILSAYPEETFRGKVLFVGDLLDPDTRCVKVRVAFPNPEGRLKPGMFASAVFTGKTESVVRVPNTAIFQMNGAARVFVESAPWKFEPREVKLGAQDGDRTIVLAGLDSSTRIVTKEGSLLR